MNLSTDFSTNFLKNMGGSPFEPRKLISFIFFPKIYPHNRPQNLILNFVWNIYHLNFLIFLRQFKKIATVSGTITDSLRDSHPSLPFDFSLYKFLFTPLTAFSIALQLNVTLRISICQFSRQQ